MDFEAPDWKALHSSLSRRRRFAFCPVGYYLYHVAGRDGYADHPDDWRYMVYCAKHCISADAWVKNLFRRAAGEFFRKGSDFRKNTFPVFVRRSFERDFTLLERCEFLSDPKIVNSVVEIESGALAINSFYEQALLKLNELIDALSRQDFFEKLCRLPMVDFVVENNILCWQLGGVNFCNTPDLMYHADNQLNILDMNSYSYTQEQLRSAALLRAYCWRFRRIPPENVNIINLDLNTFRSQRVGVAPEDFTEIFRALTAEAAMWRDYLLKQSITAKDGEWHYAQLDKCQYCRFSRVCPACHGTAEDENGSINF